MNTDATVLVLGAYGLAGRAIVARLASETPYRIVAAGRNAEKLRALVSGLENARVSARICDAEDVASLRAACSEASFVINAVGPFARCGAAIARGVLECGRPYLDCANEQRHYRRLRELDGVARTRGLPLITAAGAIPGLSTLFVAELLAAYSEAVAADCCWAQYRHAYAESGLASMMGGILEAADRPSGWHGGRETPVVLGRSSRVFDLEAPFGRKQLLELPTIDALTLPKRFAIRDYRTWFYMGELPMWLLGVVRLLQPGKRRWAYRLIEAAMRRINDRDTQNAIDAGVGPEALLMASVQWGDTAITRQVLFRDGAVATACLPVHIVRGYLEGAYTTPGLITPLDLIAPGEVISIAGDSVLRAEG